MTRQVFVLGQGKVLTAIATKKGVPAIAIAHAPEGESGTPGTSAGEHAEHIEKEGTFLVFPSLSSALAMLDLLDKAVREAERQQNAGEGTDVPGS